MQVSFSSYSFRVLVYALLAMQAAHAGLGDVFQKDSEVLVVAEVTKEGKQLSAPTKDAPVYYEGRNLGYRDFSYAIPGEPAPMPTREVNQWVTRLLAKQGYLGAGQGKMPTLYLVLSYGTLNQSGGLSLNANGTALRFLGGDKLDLMWEAETPALIGPNVLRRNARDVDTSKVMEAAAESLFIATIKAFDYEDLLKREKTTLLWQVRIACPSRGLAFNETLKTMFEIAAPSVGRESGKPTWVAASDFRKTRVEIGESTVTEQWERDAKPVKPAPSDQR